MSVDEKRETQDTSKTETIQVICDGICPVCKLSPDGKKCLPFISALTGDYIELEIKRRKR